MSGRKKNKTLIPNKSYGIFIIGDAIKKHISLPHLMEPRTETYLFDSYDFHAEGVTIWTDDDKIQIIHCDTECYWQNRNLIGMPYEEFVVLTKQQPDEKETEYVPVSPNRGQNQTVYTFYDLGLQVWVWRKKIKTVLISNYNETP